MSLCPRTVFLRLCLQSVWIWRLSLQTVWFLRLRSSDIRTKAFPSHSAQRISESSVRVISDSKVIPWPKFWRDCSEKIINSGLWIFISAIAIRTCYSALNWKSVSKRSLPLRCFKGENIGITFIISYLWQFFQNGKISRYSHVLCSFQFHN